jgi:hypothetical protein
MEQNQISLYHEFNLQKNRVFNNDCIYRKIRTISRVIEDMEYKRSTFRWNYTRSKRIRNKRSNMALEKSKNIHIDKNIEQA